MQKNQIIFVGFYILGSSLALYTEIKELNMEVIIIAKIVEAVEAVKLVRSGDVVMIGGFGNVGNPKRLIDLLADTDIYDLTVIANDLGTPNVGLGRWVRNRMLKKAIGTYFTYNTEAAELYFDGKLNSKSSTELNKLHTKLLKPGYFFISLFIATSIAFCIGCDSVSTSMGFVYLSTRIRFFNSFSVTNISSG